MSNISKICWIPFIDRDGNIIHIPDIVQNVLFFLPFGFIGFLSMKRGKRVRILLVTFLGALLSLIVEILQLFTIDRSSSITDLATNTAGTFIGAIAAFILSHTFSKIITLPRFQQYSHDRYLFLVIISFFIVIVGTLQPFDFTLDVGSVWPKIKALIHNPFYFSPVLYDEGVVFFRQFLFGYVCILWFWKRKQQYYVMKGIVVSSVISMFLEGCQLIVGSRMPGVQDVVVIMFGSFCGGLFTGLKRMNISPTLWCILVMFATWITAGVQVLSPFRLAVEYRDFNWVPFLPYYERTTFVALADFIESMLMYFPMGFVLQYFLSYSYKKYILIFIGIVGTVIAFSLEFTQGWIEGRYPDITYVLGAMIGSILGSRVCSEGWNAFDRYFETK